MGSFLSVKTKKISVNKLAETAAKNAGFTFYKNNTKHIFYEMVNKEWITRSGDEWKLTELGISKGGEYTEKNVWGEKKKYIVWPESLLDSDEISISELIKPYNMTHDRKSKPLPEAKGTQTLEIDQEKEDFRLKFPAKHRANDGHFVRSRAEALIDDWLYTSNLVHAYERKLPVKEDVYSDFYLPQSKVYIEFWGLEEDARYANRKKEKIRIYEKYGLNLIELGNNEIDRLDDVLPQKLLEFGIKTF